MKTARLFFLMSVSMIFNISLLQAQTDSKEGKLTSNILRNESFAGYPRKFTYWLSGGVGGSSYGLSGGLSISAQLGRSLFSIRYVSSSRYGEGFTIGIPLEVQLFFTPFSTFGIGINGFANLNPKRSYSGILICLQCGTLR
jgi:hypothetical protein